MNLKDFPIQYSGRCSRCFMHDDLCICQDFKDFPNKTKLTVIMHHRERYKTTNTGRLAAEALKKSEVLLRGLPGHVLKLEEHIHEPEKCLFLFPHDESRDLSDFKPAELKAFSELVVPDGNWGQAQKVGAREPLVKKMTWVKLPAGPPSQYYLRKEPTPEGMATMEAIARTLGVVEGPQIQEYLEHIFNTMVERTLKTRPKNRQDQNRKHR